jgi:hypothetical protein
VSRRLAPHLEAEIIRLWDHADLSAKEIARRLGIWDTAVRRVGRAFGLPPKQARREDRQRGARRGAEMAHEAAEIRAEDQVARCDVLLAADRQRRVSKLKARHVRVRCQCGGMIDLGNVAGHTCGSPVAA